MKLNRTYLFIAISSIALLIVLVIQVNWILETARIKEEMFNEKANMVLSRTTEALVSDPTIRSRLESGLGNREVRKIDSMLTFYMEFYNFHIDYYFEVKPGSIVQANQYGAANNVCRKSLDDIAGTNGMELKLVFPAKEQFIMAELGIPFIASVMLILVVLVMFWRTIYSLMEEKKLSEYKTDFLNNMTHEFKTPLTNIALAGKMIQKELVMKQDDKIKHYSGIILEENEKLSLQVDQVLSMAALERGEIPLWKTELNFHQLINDALKCMNMQVENKHGKVKLNLDAEHHIITGDKNHLTNALCNLIDNALKYSDKNPEISIKTSNTDQYLMLVVSDNGIGIENEYHEKVFDKFFRIPTGNVHDVKGFGMGLSYVKTIIEMHDGTINLESDKDSGTTFTLNLPYV